MQKNKTTKQAEKEEILKIYYDTKDIYDNFNSNLADVFIYLNI
jgi:hypothetical protein